MSYGEVLHRERQRQGIDLSTMSQRLHIRPDILSSIEQSDFDRMPARGYSKNMIRAYARALGLDEQQILDSYLQEVHYHELGGIRAPSSRSDSPYRRDRASEVSYRGTSRPTSDRSRSNRLGSDQPLSQSRGSGGTSRRSRGGFLDDEPSFMDSPRRTSSSLSAPDVERRPGSRSQSSDLGRSEDQRRLSRSSRSRSDSRPTSSSDARSGSRTPSRNIANDRKEGRGRAKPQRGGGQSSFKVGIAGLFGSGSGTRGTKVNRSINMIGSTPPYAQQGRDRSSRMPISLSNINLPIIIGIVCVVLILVIIAAILAGGAQQKAEEVPSIPISGLTDTSEPESSEPEEPAAPVKPAFVDVRYSIPSGEKSWLEIYLDGSSTPESAGVVDGPVNETIEVTGSLTIKAANPDSVTVTADGKELSWSKESSSGYYAITVNYADYAASSSSSSAATSSSSSKASSSSSSSTRSSSSSSSRSTS